ncbi:hypothetical protein HDU76_010061, partial [Blyttiomyces sp. JEL0837]
MASAKGRPWLRMESRESFAKLPPDSLGVDDNTGKLNQRRALSSDNVRDREVADRIVDIDEGERGYVDGGSGVGTPIPVRRSTVYRDRGQPPPPPNRAAPPVPSTRSSGSVSAGAGGGRSSQASGTNLKRWKNVPVMDLPTLSNEEYEKSDDYKVLQRADSSENETVSEGSSATRSQSSYEESEGTTGTGSGSSDSRSRDSESSYENELDRRDSSGAQIYSQPYPHQHPTYHHNQMLETYEANAVTPRPSPSVIHNPKYETRMPGSSSSLNLHASLSSRSAESSANSKTDNVTHRGAAGSGGAPVISHPHFQASLPSVAESPPDSPLPSSSQRSNQSNNNTTTPLSAGSRSPAATKRSTFLQLLHPDFSGSSARVSTTTAPPTSSSTTTQTPSKSKWHGKLGLPPLLFRKHSHAEDVHLSGASLHPPSAGSTQQQSKRSVSAGGIFSSNKTSITSTTSGSRPTSTAHQFVKRLMPSSSKDKGKEKEKDDKKGGKSTTTTTTKSNMVHVMPPSPPMTAIGKIDGKIPPTSVPPSIMNNSIGGRPSATGSTTTATTEKHSHFSLGFEIPHFGGFKSGKGR